MAKSSSPSWSERNASASKDETFPPAPEARQDVREIWAYIARDNIEAAARVRQEIRDACRRLAQYPYIGHPRDDLTSRKDVLFWPVYSYLILYRPDARPLEVLRVLHGKRDVTGLLA
jgi:plasmid stabilization system protein ParE